MFSWLPTRKSGLPDVHSVHRQLESDMSDNKDWAKIMVCDEPSGLSEAEIDALSGPVNEYADGTLLKEAVILAELWLGLAVIVGLSFWAIY